MKHIYTDTLTWETPGCAVCTLLLIERICTDTLTWETPGCVVCSPAYRAHKHGHSYVGNTSMYCIFSCL